MFLKSVAWLLSWLYGGRLYSWNVDMIIDCRFANSRTSTTDHHDRFDLTLTLLLTNTQLVKMKKKLFICLKNDRSRFVFQLCSIINDSIFYQKKIVKILKCKTCEVKRLAESMRLCTQIKITMGDKWHLWFRHVYTCEVATKPPTFIQV